jgi:hypothetical protein
MWFWSNGDVPASILSGSPSIDDLGTPSADFGNENCDISEAFDDEQMIMCALTTSFSSLPTDTLIRSIS